MKLYEISDELRTLDELMYQLVDDETGEILEADKLEELENEIKEKLVNKASGIIKVIKNYDAEIKALKDEEKRLSNLRKSKEKRKDYLKAYVSFQMQGMGTNKIETELGNLALRRSEKIIVTDEQLIPEDYKEYVETCKVNKSEIKKALKVGKEIKGVVVEENFNLNIK